MLFILTGLCNNMWGESFKYVPDTEPCMMMDFEGPNPNVNVITSGVGRNNLHRFNFWIIVIAVLIFVTA